MDDPKQKVSGLMGQQVGQDDQQTIADDQNIQQAPQQIPSAPKQKEQQPTVQVETKKVEEVEKLMKMGESDRIAKEEHDEYWENYSREIELEKEVLEMGGVEKIDAGEVPIPEHIAKEMGIKPGVNHHTPMATAGNFSVSGVSLDDSQISNGIKKPTSSGFKWLSEWFIYQLLKAHYHIKRVKDNIVRSK